MSVSAVLRLEARFLHIPIKLSAGKVMVILRRADNGALLTYFEAAIGGLHDYDFLACWDGKDQVGMDLELEIRGGAVEWQNWPQSDEKLPARPAGVSAPARPRWHFTCERGWLNDPNGLFYYQGTYHLFFQHSPFTLHWTNRNMCWGHAVSRDLLHWQELAPAIVPDETGLCWSGGALLDHQNASGLQTGEHPPILLFYTAAGTFAPQPVPFTQAMACSCDGGWTFRKYQGNPVIGPLQAESRDPKVVYYPPGRFWVMVLFVAWRGEDAHFAWFRSEDLLHWRLLQELDVAKNGECPDFFPLTDPAGELKWVFMTASGTYQVGQFDGRGFQPETPWRSLRADWGQNGLYAVQTWNNAPAGRCILIGWLRSEPYPGAAFSQQMSLPLDLALQADAARGYCLTARPVAEFQDLPGVSSTDFAPGLWSDSYHVWLSTGRAADFTLCIRSGKLQFSARKQTLLWGSDEYLLPPDSGLELEIVVDTMSWEVFLDGGRKLLAVSQLAADCDRVVGLTADPGDVRWFRVKALA